MGHEMAMRERRRAPPAIEPQHRAAQPAAGLGVGGTLWVSPSIPEVQVEAIFSSTYYSKYQECRPKAEPNPHSYLGPFRSLLNQPYFGEPHRNGIGVPPGPRRVLKPEEGVSSHGR